MRATVTCAALVVLSALTGRPAAAAPRIEQVSLSEDAFNPGLPEALQISYSLSESDRVWVRVYDSDGGLVRLLVDGEVRDGGSHREGWDGRDLDGRVVPDAAYFVTIETASGSIYDPTTLSGGVVGDITDGRFDRQAGTMTYRLPEMSRVLVRLGIRNGPMLKTLVDWKPRSAGAVTEYWNGRDEDEIIDLWGQPGFTALVTYVTLPDATVIAYGNRKETYREYKLGRARGRPKKPVRARQLEAEERLRPEGLVPPAWARAPQVSLTFPGLDGGSTGLPEASDEIATRVEVDPTDRELLQRDQFEIIFFVDNVFFAEAERGYLPFNWRWELGELPPGEHVLTVNVSSFKGQVGVASRKVRVVRE